MSLVVQKFGGTSVGDVQKIKNVALEVLKKARNSPGHCCADLKDNPL
jgi:aspartokinase